MSSRRGGKSGGRAAPTREVQVSKKLSWLLRHGAEKEGLQLQEGGFISVSDVLSNRNIQSLKVTLEEVQEIVRDNDKQRFTLTPASESVDPTSSNPKDYLIRANQGHSLKVESEGLLQPITAENAPESAVHGTTHSAWLLIAASGGLKPMGRNHVHFASGLPEGFKSVVEAGSAGDEAPVISGMRKSSTILMFLDIKKAMEAGVEFWLSDNGVILSAGNVDGLIPLEYFKRVEDRTGEGVLLEDGKVVKEAPEKWAKKGNTKS
ncbi:related to tRNA 2`-phosphotransferase [Ramularia collo-cygni]|uniref:2'-phosphotransferase n=1 Tax=Ramularia collo-cygni TaxID=112498 RepID=A0A2D3VCB5_9PEZI|nr:related to tRNA 2`-phosphotransferase [Ramularia collo-cygni]CZT22632.1 related to tRNA 2`-phosphotransferase [Ramularia collo-cygni]